MTFVDAHAAHTVVAAVDAPLIVPSDEGRRPCEAQVGQLFGRFNAGAYPANRSNPSFSPEPRGARLAGRLSWELDPEVRPAAGRRMCIEVYPHPAMIVLFALDTVIPYKAKRGRELLDLKDAYRRLLGHLETTCGPVLQLTGSALWRRLRSVTEAAVRKSELDAVEDEIDAIFCAYLAYLWATEPDRLMVLGDVTSGYIVTPAPAPTGATKSPGPISEVRLAEAPTKGQEELRAAFRQAVPRLTDHEVEALVRVAVEAGTQPPG